MLVGDEHNIVGFDGFLVGLFAFGIGFVDLGPRGKNEYLRIVAEILNGMLEFGRWGLMGEVYVRGYPGRRKEQIPVFGAVRRIPRSGKA